MNTVRMFKSHDLFEVERKINEYAEKNILNVVSVTMNTHNINTTVCHFAAVIFEVKK